MLRPLLVFVDVNHPHPFFKDHLCSLSYTFYIFVPSFCLEVFLPNRVEVELLRRSLTTENGVRPEGNNNSRDWTKGTGGGERC